MFGVQGRITLIKNFHRTLRSTRRLRLVLNIRLLLLYCMLMLGVVQVCRMLLLSVVLLVGWLLVNLVLVVVWGLGVVLIKRFWVMRLLPVHRQLSHDRLVSGTFCVMAHVVIWHPILRLGVLLAGLVPRGEEKRKKMKVKEKRERSVIRRRQKKIRTRQEKTHYVWCLMGCENSRVRQTYKTRYLQTYSTCADIHLFVFSALHSLHQCVCQPIFPCLSDLLRAHTLVF